jgi:hypothetical protein
MGGECLGTNCHKSYEASPLVVMLQSMIDQPLPEDQTLLQKKCCPLEAFFIMCWELWQILKLCTVHQT